MLLAGEGESTRGMGHTLGIGREWVAQSCGVVADLGEKGKRRILHNVAPRKAFLAAVSHRSRFVYTPKHASWLNQVEIWFSILSRRLLKRLRVNSTQELKQKLFDVVDYFNRTIAKPFKWTYSGRPLQA